MLENEARPRIRQERSPECPKAFLREMGPFEALQPKRSPAPQPSRWVPGLKRGAPLYLCRRFGGAVFNRAESEITEWQGLRAARHNPIGLVPVHHGANRSPAPPWRHGIGPKPRTIMEPDAS